MSDLTEATSGLIFGSALYNESVLSFEEVKIKWMDHFGPSVEFHHPFFPMKEYYSKQMGSELNRVLFFSLGPTKRENLILEKVWADEWEKSEKSSLCFRPLNLDIGMLTLENVTLATGKNFAHRIYLGNGVYSDLNLQYEQKSFHSLSWTYPDYAHPDFIQFFNWMRGFLHRKIS